MKLEYLIIIPALAVGWALGSYRLTEAQNPSPSSSKNEVAISKRKRNLRSKTSTIPEAPTSTEQCREALGDLLDRDDFHPMIKRALQDQILRTWVELDPEDALSFAEGQVRSGWKNNIAKDLFRVWVDIDSAGAKRAFSVASPALISSCLQTFCENLGRKDPAGTLEFIESRQWVPEGGYAREKGIQNIYRNWAMEDPEAALTHAGENDSIRNAALAGWAQVDPVSAWQAATAGHTDLKNTHQIQSTLKILAPYVLSANPDLFKHYDSETRGEALDSWVNADFEKAREIARGLASDSELRKGLDRAFAKKLATSDPERALALFEESGGSPTSSYQNSGLFRKAFISLNSTDPSRAKALLNEIPEQHRTIALGGILTHEFAANPAQAIIRSREFLDDPATQNSTLPALNRALSWGHGSGNHDLTEIVEAIPELRSSVTGYLLEGWVRTAPEAAASFLAEEAHRNTGLQTSIYDHQKAQGSDAEHDPGLAPGIAELTFSRPEFTSEWVGTLPPGDFQNNVASSLATNWARFDRDAAEAWVQSLAAGVMKEQASKALTHPVTTKAPY